MSRYIKLIIFIVVLIAISAVLVFMDSSVDNINKTMPEISDAIVSGDADYNEAVKLVNSKNFTGSMAKAESAGNSYNESLTQLKSIKEDFSSKVNDIQSNYIDTVIDELELKIQAVDKLEQSIECFKVNSNYTGSNYASEANDLIYDAVQYQNQRDEIVKNNSDLFK